MPAGPRRPPARLSGFAARSIALGVLLAPSLAVAQAAQPSGALDRFDPARAGAPLVSFPSADGGGRLRFGVAAWSSYAHDPLVLTHSNGGNVLEWVSDQEIVHVQASAEVWKRIKVDVDVPVVLLEGGTSG